MTEKFQPAFLQNSPSLICDQILYLVKNSNLNFELHETPFSLNLTIKKSFVNHWTKSNHSAQQTHVHQQAHHVHQHVNDPGPHQPPHHPSVGQPGQLSARLPRQAAENIPLNQQHHLQQQQAYSPQHHTLAHSSQQYQQPNNLENITDPMKYPQDLPVMSEPKTKKLLEKFNLIQGEHQKSLAENLEAQKEYAELDKAHRKLLKEHRELQARHSKVCSEVKTLKTDKENVVKEMNALSVAFQSSKKDSDATLRKSRKENETLKVELENLMEFKIKRQEEIKMAKKSEKKLRQKEKKQAAIAVKEPELMNSVQSEEEITKKESVAAKAIDEIKDNENNGELKTETYIYKSEDPRFLDFPSSFADWSEDQKKDAYDNNFKLYLQKYFFIGSVPK